MVFDLNDLQLTEIMSATPNGALIVDKPGTILYANQQALNLFGYTDDELIGQPVDILVPLGVRGHHGNNRSNFNVSPHARSFPASAGLHGQHRNGSLIPMEIGLVPINSAKLGPLTLVSLIDITHRRKAEDMQEVLIRELNHRVKNNMALVTSIASMTRKYTSTIDEFFTAFAGRMTALSAAHDLVASKNWEDTDTRSLLISVIQPFQQCARFTIEGPYSKVPAVFASTVAIVFHELATNALKYGALKHPDGAVEVRWEFIEDDNIVFDWIETSSVKIEPPTKRGFGTIMIERTITKNFAGTITMDYRPQGLHVRMVAKRL